MRFDLKPFANVPLLVLLAGCISVAPQRITADRMGYGEVVAAS